MKRSLIVFPALAIAVSVSCSVGDTVAGSSAPTTKAPAVRPTSTTTAKGGASRSMVRVAAGIPVARERGAGYRRELFRHWTDDDGDGCNTREEVLIAESTSRAQVDPYGCKVVAGDWYSPYDGVTHTDPSDLDIDHLVPLKEAWDSGAHSWSSAKRRQFANDLSDTRSLIAVTAGENRSKGDKDPSNWMPDRREYWCTYVADWIAVKSRWGLSMDQSEAGRVRKIAATCASTVVPAWGQATESSSASGSPGAAVDSSPGTTVPVATTVTARPPVTDSTGQATLPEGVPGRFCAPEGAEGTYKGAPVVCSKTKADGTPYVDKRARWVRT